MTSFLRTWRFCRVSRGTGDPVRWCKTRMRSVRFWRVPGNVCLRLLGTGYRVCGSDWAEYETRVFNLAHPGLEPAVVIDPMTITLPHVEGVMLSKLRGEALRKASAAAFAELGRFHRINARMIHSDPHAGNFLHSASEGRCRIIDFETAPLGNSDPGLGRAMDFAILAMDLVRIDRALQNEVVLNEWSAAYDLDDVYCPARERMASPPCRLRFYWRLIGLSPRVATGGNLGISGSMSKDSKPLISTPSRSSS